MFRSKLIAATFALLFILSLSDSAFACACCSERGYRSMQVSALTPYQRDLLKDMKMADSAEIYLDAGGYEEIKGLAELNKEFNDGGLESLDLISSYLNNSWKITIKTPAGKTGTLTLPRPAKITVFKVDLFEKAEGDPLLYKEFSFSGNVGSGTGAFKAGIAPATKYNLVFSGRGNFCDNAEDFSNWRLEVIGTKASYSFFGKMKG